MPGVLVAGDLGIRDPGADALATAFARELPRWSLAITATRPQRAAWVASPRDLVDLRRPRQVLRAIRSCDVLVLGDDALRGRGPETAGRATFAMAVLAKLLGRRLVVLGVGADRLQRRGDRRRVAALVRWSDLLVLRDAAAADVLMDAGAPGPFRVGADPAWCALTAPIEPAAVAPQILVILDARTVVDDPHVVTRLVVALDLVAARGLRIRIAPWRVAPDGDDDLELARAIAGRLGARARVLLPPEGLADACREAARAQTVLTMRTHGLMVAAAVGRPAVALGGEPELAHLAGRLGQVRLSADVDPRTLATTILDAPLSASSPAAGIAAETRAAREGFRLLRLLLEGAGSDEDHDVVALPLVPDPFLAAHVPEFLRPPVARS